MRRHDALAKLEIKNKRASTLKVGDVLTEGGEEKKIARISRNPNGTLDVVFVGGGGWLLEPGENVETK